jgi:hypothetical protein
VLSRKQQIELARGRHQSRDRPMRQEIPPWGYKSPRKRWAEWHTQIFTYAARDTSNPCLSILSAGNTEGMRPKVATARQEEQAKCREVTMSGRRAI